jgi:hypothetical protein
LAKGARQSDGLVFLSGLYASITASAGLVEAKLDT